jgi:hypothetical protein
MGMFLAGVATTVGLSAVTFLILIWCAPLMRRDDPFSRLDSDHSDFA